MVEYTGADRVRAGAVSILLRQVGMGVSGERVLELYEEGKDRFTGTTIGVMFNCCAVAIARATAARSRCDTDVVGELMVQVLRDMGDTFRLVPYLEEVVSACLDVSEVISGVSYDLSRASRIVVDTLSEYVPEGAVGDVCGD